MEMRNIDGISVPFDSNWKHLAISMSGGADSALLSHMLCNIADDTVTVHVINHVRMWKTRPWQQYNADCVYNWLAQKHPNKQFIRHTNFIAPELEYGNIGASLKDEYGKSVSGDNIQQRAYAEFVCSKFDIPVYYNAVTRNPRTVAFFGMSERDIDPAVDNQHLAFMKHMERYACHPFRFVEKSWVVKQYKELDIMDLFKQTRSCEGEFAGIDYTTYTAGQPVPTCGTCFWCKEREWAIEQNK